MKQEKTFRECKLSWLEDTFGLDQMDNLPSCDNWLSTTTDISDYENESLLRLQKLLKFNVRDWHEGELDSFLASGRREPKIPFFAFQEYKRMTDPDGDPAGQALAAMLAGQTLNNNDLPIYGCHVIGSDWYFMSLEGKEFTISRDYSALTHEISDIFRALKVLKTIIAERVN